jgi:serine/threonine protein phosphatase PrpC
LIYFRFDYRILCIGIGLTFFLKVSSAEIIGRRPTMEDALSLQGHFQGREDVDFFGLFDGHAGRGVAEYCADHVHTVVLDKLKGGSDTQAALKDCWVNVNSGLKVLSLETCARHAHAPPHTLTFLST